MSCDEGNERAKQDALVAVFQDKVEHARALEKNMDKLIIDFADVFEHCEERQIKHFALDLIKKTFYLVDRVKLLKTGQCMAAYQTRTESEFI